MFSQFLSYLNRLCVAGDDVVEDSTSFGAAAAAPRVAALGGLELRSNCSRSIFVALLGILASLLR